MSQNIAPNIIVCFSVSHFCHVLSQYAIYIKTYLGHTKTDELAVYYFYIRLFYLIFSVNIVTAARISVTIQNRNTIFTS